MSNKIKSEEEEDEASLETLVETGCLDIVSITTKF